MRDDLPPELAKVREAARRALGPVLPVDENTRVDKDFLFSAKETNAGHRLPPPYLVYFVLVDLLGYRDLGRFEKLAWSVPIDFHGRAFLIEHRKFGVGVFAHDPATEEADAEAIVNHIHKAVKAAGPFFNWLAKDAIEKSSVNLVNNSSYLFDRFEYFAESYRTKRIEVHKRKDEKIIKQGASKNCRWRSITFPAVQLGVEATWLGLAAIEAFFSWSEHIFIHISVITGKVTEAEQVASLATADWAVKYKVALDIAEKDSKYFYDKLLTIRVKLRNFVAHGAFGKNGEAFYFHSSAGAVPVLLTQRVSKDEISSGNRLAFDIEQPLQTIESFISHLWSVQRAPARIYIQEYGLPMILTMVKHDEYANAMKSIEDMELFAGHVAELFHGYINMDW